MQEPSVKTDPDGNLALAPFGSASFRARPESRTFWGKGLEHPSHGPKVQEESACQEGG